MFTHESRVKIRRLRKLRAERGTWRLHKDVELGNTPLEKRLIDLSLGLVLGLTYPSYWLNERNYQQRLQQLFDACAAEGLPWQQ